MDHGRLADPYGAYPDLDPNLNKKNRIHNTEIKRKINPKLKENIRIRRYFTALTLN